MGYTLQISRSSPIQNPLIWWISDPVQSKSVWTGLDYKSSGLIQSIPPKSCMSLPGAWRIMADIGKDNTGHPTTCRRIFCSSRGAKVEQNKNSVHVLINKSMLLCLAIVSMRCNPAAVLERRQNKNSDLNCMPLHEYVNN